MAKIDKIEELQNLLRDDPQNFLARRQLAVLLTDCGFNEEALKNLLYLSKTFGDDSGIFYNLGIVYEKLKNFKKAKESYEKAIEIEPDAIDAIYNLGLVSTELCEYETAIKCFEKVISTDNQDSNSYFNLGLVYFKMKDFPKALDYFQKTVDINDEDIYAHFYIGNILREFGDNDGAKSKFEKVLEISPDYSWAYFNLASIYYEEQDIGRALDNLSNTIELNPVDIEAYKIYVKILTSIGEYSEADEIINQAIDNCGEIGDLYYIAGKIAEYSEDFERSRNCMQLALRNSSSLSMPIEKIKTELSKLPKY